MLSPSPAAFLLLKLSSPGEGAEKTAVLSSETWEGGAAVGRSFYSGCGTRLFVTVSVAQQLDQAVRRGCDISVLGDLPGLSGQETARPAGSQPCLAVGGRAGTHRPGFWASPPLPWSTKCCPTTTQSEGPSLSPTSTAPVVSSFVSG